MKTINALKVRTKFGQVLEELRQSKEPLLLTRSGTIEAALVPIELFEQRFVDLIGKDAVERLIQDINKVSGRPQSKRPSQNDLRDLRGTLR